VNRDEFIGRAADAILDRWGQGDDKADCALRLCAADLAEAALEAVGAWELLESLRPIVTADGGGSFRNLTGMNAQLALLAIAKAEGR
jgi:hypothetical protein